MKTEIEVQKQIGHIDPKMRKLWRMLSRIEGNSIWAHGIRFYFQTEAIKSRSWSAMMFTNLVKNLHSQMGDNEALMSEIIGPDSIKELKKIFA